VGVISEISAEGKEIQNDLLDLDRKEEGPGGVGV